MTGSNCNENVSRLMRPKRSKQFILINYLKPTVGIRLDGCIMQSNKITRVVLDGVISNSQLTKILTSVNNNVNIYISNKKILLHEKEIKDRATERIYENLDKIQEIVMKLSKNAATVLPEEPSIWEFNQFVNQMSNDLSIDLFQILTWTNFLNVTSILEIRTILQNNNPILVDLPEKILNYLRYKILGE